MRLNSYVTQYYNKAVSNPKIYALMPLSVYWVILFILTTIPTDAMPSLGTSDKVKHFGAYFVLALLFRLTIHFYYRFKFSKSKELILSLGVIFFYGVFDEVHQLFIPGRFFELLDLAANVIGLVIGIYAAGFIIKSGSKKTSVIKEQ